MMTNQELRPIIEKRNFRGFTNLFHKENRAWWKTRRWWVNGILWLGMMGGLVVLMVFVLPPIAEATGDPNVTAAGGPMAFGLEMGRTVFFELGTLMVAIGVIVLSQDLILEEKQNGLTEWILAKPVTRRSYLLSKLAASIISILILIVVFPSLTAYLLLSTGAGALFPIRQFLIGVGIMCIHTLFYLTLTIMLGATFSSRPPILGVTLGILFGGNLLSGFLQPLLYITPWSLAKVASLAAGGESFPPEMLTFPLIATGLWSFAFILIGLYKLEKTEF